MRMPQLLWSTHIDVQGKSCYVNQPNAKSAAHPRCNNANACQKGAIVYTKLDLTFQCEGDRRDCPMWEKVCNMSSLLGPIQAIVVLHDCLCTIEGDA